MEANLPPVQHDRTPITREIRLKAMAELVPQKHRDYYVTVFNRLEDGELISMNWGAAFWSFMWFFYHRMMKWGWVAFFAFMAVDHIGDYIFPDSGQLAIQTVNFFAPIIISIITMGFFANWLYFQHLDAIVRKSWFSRGHLLDEQTWYQSLHRKGGVDMKSAVLATLLGLSIYIVKTMVFLWLGWDASTANNPDLQQQMQQLQGLIH